MRTILLGISVLIGLTASAQDFEWQWAKRGGGTQQLPAEGQTYINYESEKIIDIVVDQDNNYYFLAFMGQGNTEFDGTPVNVYNPTDQTFSFTDIVLISTDCSGTLRWTQTIGGADRDFAYKIVLDHNGGLYLGAYVNNIAWPDSNNLPPHFSPDDSLPVLSDFNNGAAQPGHKSVALLKYNTGDGSLAWRVMPQGEVGFALRDANINEVIIDSEGILHVLIGFRAGTHLNGQITVPDTFTNTLKYYLVKYNRDGNLISASPLSLEGGLFTHSTDFRYDENLGRYYLAGFRNYGGSDPLYGLSFNGVPFTKQAYILAFGTSGDEIWRKEVTCASQFQDSRFLDLEIDSDSNLYLSGKYFIDGNNPVVGMDGYQFPSDLFGNVQYVMKMNPAGEVQWFSKPSGYTTFTGFFTGSHFGDDLVINGNEIALATQVCNEIWGNFPINRPVNHRSDPAILRLDKATGTPIALQDIMGVANYDDAFTAITVDNDGNYIAGGYFINNIFTAANDNVPTLTKVFDQTIYSDFFISKLASGPCNGLATEDFAKNSIDVYPNPAKDKVYVQSNENLTGFQISNMLGQIVGKGSLTKGENTISIAGFHSGTYIISFKTIEGETISRKIIKK